MALLEIRNLTRRFGGLVAVSDVSFDVEQGQIIGLIGPNGAGKTTIFNLISGVYAPTSGEVTFDGRIVTGLPPHNIAAAGVGRTFQVVMPFAELTVLENVMVGAFLRTSRPAEARARAEQVVELVGLGHKAEELARSLTLPDRKRLEVSRALATEPKLLLLDEVMAGLNPTEVQAAVALVRDIRATGVTILMIEHVMQATMSVCERIVVLNYGQVLAEGTPQEVTSNPDVITAYLGEGFASA